MFGPGRHFPPAELREWERRERLDPEYQLSARPPSTAQPSPALPVSRLRPEKSERIFAKGGRREEEGAGRKREGKPRGANVPGIGRERHPRLSSWVILIGDPRLGRINAPP